MCSSWPAANDLTIPMHSLLTNPTLADCRRLFLRNYEVRINIGVHDFEKKGEQRVLINVDLFVPLKLSTPTHDELGEVLDYDFIRRSIAERVARGHIHLQETLVDDVLKLMLAHPNVKAARVSTEKPDVYPDCDAVGVEVFALKDAA
jgi:7,8-dihydroneopterin aldolase/epimerase/oxygenase